MEFKPSEVAMWRGVAPLIGTFGKSEWEFAAALMVLACKANGDRWQSLEPRQVGLAMANELKEGGELHHLFGNPFLFPDMRGLAKAGFAEFDGDPEKGSPIRFTEKGLEILSRTVRS